MAITIHHRFLDRLTSTIGFDKVDVIIIGTFNPGQPDPVKLNSTERKQFEEIRTSKKFIKFNQVKNFYDRPQNRFWKVMDYINDIDFYSTNAIDSINYDGLKYYTGMDRAMVFERQKKFCKQRGILITDIAKTINPLSFCDIYDNFPDTAIEKASPVWNTSEIIAVIKEHNPKKVIVNFKSDSNSTPKICSQITEITKTFPNKIVSSLKSTSGAAGFKYSELIDNWKDHFI